MYRSVYKNFIMTLAIFTALSCITISASQAKSKSFSITAASFNFAEGNNSFSIKGKISPGSVNLVESALTLDAGSYSEIINAGSFTKKGKIYTYECYPDSTGISKMIINLKKKTFSINASGVDLSGMTNPADVYISIGDSSSKCTTIKMKKTKQGTVWKLKGKSAKCKEAGKSINPESGGSISIKDGAKVSFPETFGTAGVYASFKRSKKTDGNVSDDKKTVSGEYLLKVTGAGRVQSNITISIPIKESLLPDGWKEHQLQPEYYDSSSKEWVPDGNFVVYDSTNKKVTFNVSFDNSSSAEQASLRSSTSASYRAEGAQVVSKYRIRVYMLSDALTATQDGSNFSITYYPSSLGKKYSIKADTAWNSSTGNATDPAVPDYVEDLDTTLNNSYTAMLALKNSGSNDVFSALTTPQEVLVTDCGGDAGESPIGGPMKISNSKIGSWADMKNVAAHELVHVFQNQYYTGGTSGNVINYFFNQNRWFIEATANYYSAQVNGLDDEAKKDFIKNDGYSDYLSVPLTSTSDNSMYAVMHFLDWLSANYSSTIVGDTLAKGSVSTDLSNMSDVLKDNGATGGIGDAFDAFGAYLIKTPDGYGKFNNDIKDAMQMHTFGNKYVSALGFTDNIFFIKLKKTLDPLTMVYAQLKAMNSTDALLVIDTSGSSGDFLKSYSYDFVGASDSDYSGNSPIDAYDTIPSSTPLTVEHFGKSEEKTDFEQLIINTIQTSKAEAEVVYYLLIPPEVKSTQDGSVLWTFTGIGKGSSEIPRQYITGFNVFLNGTKLNTTPVSLPKSGTEQSYTDVLIKSTDTIEVQIVDKYGNVWPDITGEGNSDTSITPLTLSATFNGCYNGVANVTISGTGTLTGPSGLISDVTTGNNGRIEIQSTIFGEPAISVTVELNLSYTFTQISNCDTLSSGWCTMTGDGYCITSMSNANFILINKTTWETQQLNGTNFSFTVMPNNGYMVSLSFDYTQTFYVLDGETGEYYVSSVESSTQNTGQLYIFDNYLDKW